MRIARAALWSLVLCALVGACSSSGRRPGAGGGAAGGDAGTATNDGGTTERDRRPGVGDLRLEPADHEVVIQDGTAETIDYRAFLVGEGGAETEVTEQAEFWLAAPVLGSFEGPRLTVPGDRGGTTRVFASHDSARGEARLTIRVERIVIGPGAGADAPDQFGGADDPSRAPELLYPADGALVPPNLNELEFHFRPNGNTLFELAFDASTIDLRVYFGCEPLNGGCVYTPDQDVWETVAEAARGGDGVTYVLRGVEGSAPGGVGSSAEQTILFAQENITGGLYYWNAEAGSIRRYDFGLRGQSAENFIDAGRAGATTCVGCHAISRDGSRIAVGMDIPGPAAFKVFDVATREVQFGQSGGPFGGAGANFFTFSPDASEIAVSDSVDITILDSDDGSMVADVAEGTMPDWSPDGQRIVFARSEAGQVCAGGICSKGPAIASGSIESLVSDGSMWQPGPTLVPRMGDNNFYPTFSPDGQWVLFNRSPSNTASMSDDDMGGTATTDFELWVVPSVGGPQIQLENATVAGDSWPKWDPTEYEHQGHPLFWLTFTSHRPYGLRIPEGGQSQLWMAAFDPTEAAVGEDGSFPAVWLPFQEVDGPNHIAQWVTEVHRQGCVVEGDCGEAEFCSDGVCIPRDVDPI